MTTSGHIKILRGSGNRNAVSDSDEKGFIFYVPGNAKLNIGSEGMLGTIEISGGAIYTLETTMTYDFDTEKSYGGGNNGTRNNKKGTNGKIEYVLFNDGDDYRTAHWYKVTGVDSTHGLIRNKGTLNVYGNTRLGDVFVGTPFPNKNRYQGGAINNRGGKVYIYGGEISWNAMGQNNDNLGAAIYSGTNSTVTIYDCIIQYNTALDNNLNSTNTQENTADGGAIG